MKKFKFDGTVKSYDYRDLDQPYRSVEVKMDLHNADLERGIAFGTLTFAAREDMVPLESLVHPIVRPVPTEEDPHPLPRVRQRWFRITIEEVENPT